MAGKSARMRTHDFRHEEASVRAARNLFEAVEQLRADVAKVELWARAVAQFAQPVPVYEANFDPKKAKLWIPKEQGATLSHRIAKAG
jgi:hypothetical protein